MKLILSRKGFDAATGRYPSPILPSGELYSLPIPEPEKSLGGHEFPRRYEEIRVGNMSLGKLVYELTNGNIRASDLVHLDPDLNFSSVTRPPNWRPLFGQAAVAEAHLQKRDVTSGDIFLFYGWFRKVEVVQGRFRYVPGSPDLHVIFGWLQIDRRIDVSECAEIETWAAAHPHCKSHKYDSRDSIYISRPFLNLPGIKRVGAGTFTEFHSLLRLTNPSSLRRSVWKLPRWFYPEGRKSHLSYHGALSRWTRSSDFVQLQTVGRGQEFVLDCNDYPEALQWLIEIFANCL